MLSVFAEIGVFTALLAVFLIIRKVNAALYRRSISESVQYQKDHRILQAASDFARGKPADEVRKAMSAVAFLEEEDIEEILAAAEPYRSSDDGGYRAFMNEVHKTLDASVY